MNRLAIFVEGLTEQEFVARLVVEMAGAKNVRIEKRKAFGGGGASQRRHVLVEAISGASGERFYVLIVDCGADNRVKSDVRDNYDGLVAKGYQGIIAVRDVYPNPRAEIAKLRQGFAYKLKTKPIEVKLMLAIMEIEAWFLAEYTHFPRINSGLDLKTISANMGFDPSVDDVELRPHPSADLHQIYQLAGLAYHKTKAQVQRTVSVLDYACLYFELPGRVSGLSLLIESLEQFFSL